ncbi:unnamed protein product [Microthlaspi erraticum]|uniref:FHA domain-containing protein n=1 Tax=Microthlaspi erraticum TaxID=1685480 RepID=A0A6D2IND0_9BRAS|nr:unnamed protein product [Microthlaspi erraticum]
MCDTLQCNPGLTMGRIARGNEIAVKDAGISTKHLPLNPYTPIFLRDGDIIEIGKCTSIVVNFVTDVLEHKLPKSLEEKGLGVGIEVEPISRVRKEDKVQRNWSFDSCVNAIEVETENAKNSNDTTKRSKKIEIVAEEAIKEKSVTMATRSNKNQTQTPNQMSSNDFSSFNEETSVNNGSSFSLGSVSPSAFHPNRDQLLEIERLRQERDATIEKLAKIRQEFEGPNTFLVFLQKKFPDSFRPKR